MLFSKKRPQVQTQPPQPPKTLPTFLARCPECGWKIAIESCEDLAPFMAAARHYHQNKNCLNIQIEVENQ